jgi:hypothetical protein
MSAAMDEKMPMPLLNAAVAPILAMDGAMQLPRAQRVYNVRRCSVSDVYRVMHDILFQKFKTCTK